MPGKKKERQRLPPKQRLIYYGAGGGIAVALSWLFFESILMSGLLLPILVFLEGAAAEELRQRQKQKWEEDFGRYLAELDSYIRLGHSLESGMTEAIRKSGLLLSEDWMLKKLEMNVYATDIFRELAERRPTEGLKYFAAVIDSSLQSGSNLHELMSNHILQLQKKLQMEREIQSLLTKAKYESRMLTLFVPLLLLYLKGLSPNFRQIMYLTLSGKMVMAFCLGLYLLASYLCYSMTQIEL